MLFRSSVHILSKSKVQKEEEIPHWYALRTTYGREKKAYDYMTAKGITAFYPTTDTVKLIKGKRKVVTESRLPNIFFAYGTEDLLKRRMSATQQASELHVVPVKVRPVSWL